MQDHDPERPGGPGKTTQQAALRARLAPLRRSDPAAALALLDADGADPDAGWLRRERAALLNRLGRNAEALAELDRLPEKAERPGVARLRARILIALGHLDRAETLIRDIGPDREAGAEGLMFGLGRAWLEAGRFTRAARCLSDAREAGCEAPALRSLELQGWLLAAEPGGLAAALDAHGGDISGALARAVRHARTRLRTDAPAAQSAALLRGALQSLHRLDNLHDLRRVKQALRGICDPAAEAGIIQRAHDLTPASIQGIAPPPVDTPPARRNLPGLARWLGIAEADIADWSRRAWEGFHHKRQLFNIISRSLPHRAELRAALPRLDWSEVQACTDRGQPVLLAGLHCHARAAVQIELLRLDRPATFITRGWDRVADAEFSPLFQPPPPRAVETGAHGDFTGTEIMRNLLRDLSAGGVVALPVDGLIGARDRAMPDRGLRLRLPPPQWALARRTGAAVFWMGAGWRDGRLRCDLTRWEVPDGSDPQAEETLWYNRMISAWKAACLADPRNALPASWICDITATPDPGAPEA